MYISTVHLLSTSGLDYLRELRSQILFESERTPGFEPGSTGCELGVVPRRHRGRWEKRAEKYVFIFNLQDNDGIRINCPKCNHIASSNVGLKNSKITPVTTLFTSVKNAATNPKTSYSLVLHVKKAHLGLSKVQNLRCQKCDLTSFSRKL